MGGEGARKKATFKEALHFLSFKTLPNATVTNVRSGTLTSYTNPAPPCGDGNGTPPQYSCLENPMDGGAWWAAVHGVTKSLTRLSDFTFTFLFFFLILFYF